MKIKSVQLANIVFLWHTLGMVEKLIGGFVIMSAIVLVIFVLFFSGCTTFAENAVSTFLPMTIPVDSACHGVVLQRTDGTSFCQEVNPKTGRK